jgi:hypothetical protein
MASLDMLILGKLVETGDMDALTQAGFSRDLLVTSEGKKLFGIIEHHYSSSVTRGMVPGLDFLQSHIEGLALPAGVTTSFEGLVSAARTSITVKTARRKIQDVMPYLGDTYDPDMLKYVHALHYELEQLLQQQVGVSDSSLDQGYLSVLKYYEDMRSGKIPHVPWPWEELHQWSPGMEDTDYTVFYGRPKNKKTFVFLYSVVQTFFKGYPVTIYSKEMPADQIWRRVVGFIAGLAYDDLRLVRLSEDDLMRMYEAEDLIRRTKQAHPGADIMCVSGMDAPGGNDTVSWLVGKLKKYKPRLSAIDGLYLMSSDTKEKDDHARVRTISRNIRNACLSTRIPCLATIQANRDAEKTGKDPDLDDVSVSEVAFSDAVGQDATALFRAVADRKTPTISMLLTAAREWGTLRGFRIRGVPCTDFGWVAPILDPGSVRELIETDTPAAAPAPKKGRSRTKIPTPEQMLEANISTLLDYDDEQQE